jgi:quinol monooxygenase YgiN
MSGTAQNGFNIQATLFFAPENIEKVFEALKPVYEKTIAEPECLSFQVYQLLEEPGQILLVEDWFVKSASLSQSDLKLTYISRKTPLEQYMTVR